MEHELLFPWRQTYCRYLHVAEVAAEGPAVPTAWDGIGGRLKQTWVHCHIVSPTLFCIGSLGLAMNDTLTLCQSGWHYGCLSSRLKALKHDLTVTRSAMATTEEIQSVRSELLTELRSGMTKMEGVEDKMDKMEDNMKEMEGNFSEKLDTILEALKAK